ncbi:hypothetical protein M436DRAFT_60128 [Aureobasidium namibiae CBS 147.97]|uniref:Uncharacterized protein n=1 Tax=Aureobasidium namibiae CBS 147.97 TaxID=1043004 RepID=A0A074XUA9_9PEZI|nr:uncharacterized protein M436DRAFT_60128 [Aureobasidium namibiae CBS 147.97]KEQ78206.1 hypothetical protein M436DRAFT_60128 [Aureobasidium namibiae CBS 147.97]
MQPVAFLKRNQTRHLVAWKDSDSGSSLYLYTADLVTLSTRTKKQVHDTHLSYAHLSEGRIDLMIEPACPGVRICLRLGLERPPQSRAYLRFSLRHWLSKDEGKQIYLSKHHIEISESDQIKRMTNMYTAPQHSYNYLFSRHQKTTTTSLSRQLTLGAGTPIDRDLRNPQRLKAKSGVSRTQQQTVENEMNRVDDDV